MDMNCPTLTGGSQANGTMGGPVPPRPFANGGVGPGLIPPLRPPPLKLAVHTCSPKHAATPPPQAAPAPPRSILHPMAMGNQQPMWRPPPPPQMRPPNKQHPSMPPPSPLNIRPLPPLPMS
ncbi:hypothetical protein M0R45_034865 [Rubus argutus]|uniref:Uncharacterized protein n=1 Tax=Rubus argutus TaxID=59490 RepID=A0AAW1VV37_RUBAR